MTDAARFFSVMAKFQQELLLLLVTLRFPPSTIAIAL